MTTHNLSSSREYNLWRNLKSACHDPRHPYYRNYGAKGIWMDPAWFNDVAQFISDIGPRPELSYRFKLINPTRGIVPGNVEWRPNKHFTKIYGSSGDSHATHKPSSDVDGDGPNRCAPVHMRSGQ